MNKEYLLPIIRGNSGLILISAVVLLFISPPPVHADYVSLFREIVKENSGIKSIDAEILQHVRQGGVVEIYRGRYRADSSGMFRVDYRVPSTQIVINTGRDLLWYYPQEKLLYKAKGNSLNGSPTGFNPLKNLQDSEERLRLVYKGKRLRGLFSVALCFIVKDTKNETSLKILVDRKKKVLLEKTLYDRFGNEIIHEEFERYKKIQGNYFPARVSVTARSVGGVIKNITTYSDIKLNSHMDAGIFNLRLSGDITVKPLLK